MPEAFQDTDTLARLAAELTDAWNMRDAERIAALCAPDYQGENVGEAAPHVGPEGMRQSVAQYLAAFPDLHFTVNEQVIQGDRVVQIWEAHATHAGPLMNIPATGRKIDVRGATLLTYRGGLVYRALYIWDVAGLLRNLGLLPQL